jgi:hypothetical protein
MSFQSIQEAEQRLQNPQPLAEQEVIDLMQWMHILGAGSRLRLQAHLGIGNMHAIQALNETSAKIEAAVRRMDEGSTRLGIVGVRLNVGLFVLTVIGILLAAFAAWVADKSYKDANASSIQQQQTLDASRRSLESASQALNQLTGLATKESQSLDRQLAISETNQKRELERLSRKPEIEITAFGNCPLNPVIRNPVIVFKSARSWLNSQFDVPRICGGQNLSLDVQNKGNSVAHHLFVRCERKPIPYLKEEARKGEISSPKVTLDLLPVETPNPNVHATEDYIQLGPLDLRPIRQEKPEPMILEANVPLTVGSYQVFCEVDEELIGPHHFNFVVAKDSVRPQ